MIRYLINRPTTDGKFYAVIAGLSTDAKPTADLITGSRFVEADTGAAYLFNETASAWNENQQFTEAVAAYLDDHPEALDQAAIEAIFDERLDGIEDDLSGLKSAITKVQQINEAIVSVFQHVAFTDEAGATAYNTLYELVYGTPTHELVSISATLDPSAIVYAWDDLDILKDNLTVMATYSDSQTPVEVTTGYTLSGTLALGNCTITVTYEGKTTTFTVLVYDFAFTAGYVNSTNNSTEKKVQVKANTARLLCDSSVGVTPLNDDSGNATIFYPMPIRAGMNRISIEYSTGYRRSIVFLAWDNSIGDFVQIYGTGWKEDHEYLTIEQEYRDGSYYVGVTFSGTNGTEDMSNVDTSGWHVTIYTGTSN